MESFVELRRVPDSYQGHSLCHIPCVGKQLKKNLILAVHHGRYPQRD